MSKVIALPKPPDFTHLYPQHMCSLTLESLSVMARFVMGSNPIKGSRCFLDQVSKPSSLRAWFNHQTKQTQGLMEDWLICQI